MAGHQIKLATYTYLADVIVGVACIPPTVEVISNNTQQYTQI
jgi:hypothetical protein